MTNKESGGSQEKSKASSIPIINFDPFSDESTHSPTIAERLHTAHSLLAAFRHHGFLYLKHHGIPQKVVADTFKYSAAFFACPQSLKDSVPWTTPSANRGYSGLGKEKVTRAETTDASAVKAQREAHPDLKESYEIGREDEPPHFNPWPPEDYHTASTGEAAFPLHGFREHMLAFRTHCDRLHSRILRALALALGLEDDWFEPHIGRNDNTLRLLHYPPVPVQVLAAQAGAVRAAAHSDYGSLTLLFQDRRGGLQVERADGKAWVDVRPLEGTVVVNAGDLLARWSNDSIRSTVHRVVEPPLDVDSPADSDGNEPSGTTNRAEYPARYSIAYFCNPNTDALIDAMPGTYGTAVGIEKHHPPIKSGEYLVQRLATTY